MKGSDKFNTIIMMIDVNQIDVVDQPVPEHGRHRYEQMMESIREGGQMQPIVAYKEDTGRYTVVEGRTRLRIRKELGHQTVLCALLDDSIDRQKARMMSYEAELCRRHLSDEEYEKASDDLENIKNQGNKAFMESLRRKLAPEIWDTLTSIEAKGELDKDWKNLFIKLSHLPQTNQALLLYNKSDVPQSEEGEKEREYFKQIDSLNRTIDEQDRRIAELKVSEAALKKIQKEFEVRAAEAIQKKKKELEAQYREDNLSSSRILEIEEKAKAKMLEKHAEDIREMNLKLRELSKAKEQAQNQIDYLREQLKSEEGKHKETALVLKLRRDDLEHQKEIIATLANTTKVSKQLQITLSDLDGVSQSLTMLPPFINDSEKEQILVLTGKIADQVVIIEEKVKNAELMAQKSA